MFWVPQIINFAPGQGVFNKFSQEREGWIFERNLCLRFSIPKYVFIFRISKQNCPKYWKRKIFSLSEHGTLCLLARETVLFSRQYQMCQDENKRNTKSQERSISLEVCFQFAKKHKLQVDLSACLKCMFGNNFVATSCLNWLKQWWNSFCACWTEESVFYLKKHCHPLEDHHIDTHLS